MTQAMRDFIAASRRIRHYVQFTVANELGHPEDIVPLKAWLDAFSRLEAKQKEKRK